jgi:outer membrane protein assembly factor BamA
VRWLVIIAVLAACHGPVHRPGDEWLQAIHFDGNQVLDSGALIDGLALHRTQQAGRPPDPYLVPLDADRIRGKYLRIGYIDVDVRPHVERHGDAVTVVYKIDEGYQAATRIKIEGLPPDVPVSAVRDVLPLADGDPFVYATYEAAKEPLLRVVADAGYAHAKLDASVFADRANRQAVIELRYTPGVRCTFGDVQVVGVVGDLADAVLRRIAFHSGERYSATAIGTTQLALYGMQRFSTVRVEPELDKGNVVPVRISVAEGASHQVTFGGGVGMDPITYEVRGRAGYTVAGWPWPLTTFDLDLRPAYALLRDGDGYEPRIRAMARLSRIDLFLTNMTGSVEGGYNYLVVEAYTSYGPRARLGLTYPLGTPRVQAAIGWQIEQLDFRDISPVLDPGTIMRLGLDQTERIGAYTQALSVDLRDNPIEPTLGAYAQVQVNEGTRYAGSAKPFLQVSPELRAYAPLGPTVLAARLRYGGVFGDVPVSERYYGGGSSSQRGFGERRLSPELFGDVNGEFTIVPIGGASIMDTGVEERVPLGVIHNMKIGGVAFLDGGDVTDTPSEMDPWHLHWAVGLGLRVFTVVGPVRFDVGYRLNRTGEGNPEPGSHWAFHLSLGEAY